jgi:GT2 family glycosyltransferase
MAVTIVSLSIIIVSWNVREDLRECLESIYATGFSDGLETIVVDNASYDGTAEMVQDFFSDVRLIVNTHNVGFPKANNQALSVAQGEFVLYLNPDTRVSQGALSTCVRFLRENEDVGLLGCKVLYPDGSVQYECARDFPSLTTMVWEAFYLHMLFPRNRHFGRTLMGFWDHQDSRDVPCLVGAFMLGRRSILQELDGMDESVFMFFEDVDLCYRIREQGWRIFYLADASIIHKSGRSQRLAGSLEHSKALAKYAFFREHSGVKKAVICWFILLVQGIFRLALSLLLFPVACLVPEAKSWLRTACVPSVHWELVKWGFGVCSVWRSQHENTFRC